MKRGLFNFLTALSLLLCVASALLWWRTFRLAERFTRVGGDTDWEVASVHGRFYVRRSDFPPAGTSPDGRPMHRVVGIPMWRPRQPWHYWREAVEGREVTDRWEPSAWTTLGFQWVPQPSGSIVSGWSLRARWASVVACTALLPAWAAFRVALGRANALRRARANRCPRCGYDLRATPDRCPECGTMPPANRFNTAGEPCSSGSSCSRAAVALANALRPIRQVPLRRSVILGQPRE